MADLNGRLMEVVEIRGRKLLAPADLMSEEWLVKQPLGSKIMMTGRRPRNPKHHAKLFALLHKVVHNVDIWSSERELLDEVKFATGLSITRRCVLIDDSLPPALQQLVDWLRWFGGLEMMEEYKRPILAAADTITGLYSKTLDIHISGSISFESMDQDRFGVWYDQAIQILATQVLGVAPETLRDEIEHEIFREDGWKQPRANANRQHRGQQEEEVPVLEG